MSKSQDEKTKLLAALLNSAAGSCLTVGVLAPIVAWFINLGEAAANVPSWKIAVCVSGFLLGSVLIHMSARQILNGLDQ